MKKNDIQKIKEKSQAELVKELGETRDEVRSLVFDLSSGKLKNHNQLREARRKVARIMTFIKLMVRQSSPSILRKTEVLRKHDKK